MEKAFALKELASIDLKQGIAEEIIRLINPLRIKIEENKKLFDLAYPVK